MQLKGGAKGKKIFMNALQEAARQADQGYQGKPSPFNLHKILSDMGHRLVEEHGFQPANLHGCSALLNHTLEPLVRFLVWLEHTPQAHFVLQEMGVWNRDQSETEFCSLNQQDQGDPDHILAQQHNSHAPAQALKYTLLRKKERSAP
jgi:hypothetical protein